jgi:ferredoxin
VEVYRGRNYNAGCYRSGDRHIFRSAFDHCRKVYFGFKKRWVAETQSGTRDGKDAAQDIAGTQDATAGAEEARPTTALVKCAGVCDKTEYAVDYQGPPTCESCNFLYKGRRQCFYACLGFGDCARACGFGAISLLNGVATVDKEKCTGCGTCVKKCPKALIQLMPSEETICAGGSFSLNNEAVN